MITDENIKHEAFGIHQLRKQAGDPDADNAIENWHRAERRLSMLNKFGYFNEEEDERKAREE